jgi:hypothetical protein
MKARGYQPEARCQRLSASAAVRARSTLHTRLKGARRDRLRRASRGACRRNQQATATVTGLGLNSLRQVGATTNAQQTVLRTPRRRARLHLDCVSAPICAWLPPPIAARGVERLSGHPGRDDHPISHPTSAARFASASSQPSQRPTGRALSATLRYPVRPIGVGGPGSQGRRLLPVTGSPQTPS